MISATFPRPRVRRILAAVAALSIGTPAAPAMIPPAPLSEAMAAVKGDYTLSLPSGGEAAVCAVHLKDAWGSRGFEVFATADVDKKCLSKVFRVFNLSGPVEWTLFEGGGIVLWLGDIEIRFRPNYMPGAYIANQKRSAGGDPLEIGLERIKP